MSQSTDAILFYGYCWDEEAELWDRDDHDEWNEAVAKRRGFNSPWDLYRDSGAEAEHNRLPYGERAAPYQAWKESVGFEALYEAWKETLRIIKAEHPTISVESHCSCDYPMPYICISETNQRAWRGTPVTVDVLKMQSETAEWDAQLDNFADALDIDLADAQGPGWFLVSNWC